MQCPPGAAVPHAHQRTAARCAVDPIEAPAPAWILDSAALEPPSSLQPPACLAPSHMAAASSGGHAMHAHLGAPVSTLNSYKLQKLLSAQAEAGQFAKLGEQGSHEGMPAFAAVAEHAEAAAGSPEKEDASADWHGFAAHAGTSTAASVKSKIQDQRSVVGDNTPEDYGAALSAMPQQSSHPESFAVFSGFDVPEDDVPTSDVPENNTALPTAQNSPEAGVTVSPSKEEEKSHAMSGNPMTDRSANASEISPAKREGRGSAVEMKPSKVDRRISGTPVAPATTHRSCSGVSCRGLTGDVPSGRETGTGASRAVGAGVRYKDGQLARGRSATAAPATGGVSGATSCGTQPACLAATLSMCVSICSTVALICCSQMSVCWPLDDRSTGSTCCMHICLCLCSSAPHV